MNAKHPPESHDVPRRAQGMRWRIARWLWPPCFGAVAGIVLRLVFSGDPTGPYNPMSLAFFLLAPLVVGAVTVYLGERVRAGNGWTWFFTAALANVLFILGALLIMVEGIICGLLALPIFATIGGIGGLMMGVICRWTDWPGRSVLTVSVLPLALGTVGYDVMPPEVICTVERAIHIAAPPTAIWPHIVDTGAIAPDEVDRGWLYRIGVPLPESGVTMETDAGRVRRITMGRGIRFDQIYREWEPNRFVLWTYRFESDSIPPRALDEHVKIGGHYFDLIDTSYALEPDASGTTLAIRMRYRVSTPFNWYAVPLSKLLFGNFEEVILNFYRLRSEP